MTDTGNRTFHNPASSTLLAMALAALAYAVLGQVTRWGADSAEGEKLLDGAPFQTWIAFAAVAVVVFGKVFRDGLAELRKEPLNASDPPPTVLAIYFVGFAVVALAVLLLGGRGGPDVPLETWRPIVGTLLGLGTTAAAPWVVAVWATHSLLHDTSRTIAQLGPLPGEGASDALDAQLQELRRFRGVIVRAVTRLLTIVLAATLMSGALRAALVPDFVSEKALPQSAVLLYGAFFTGVMATAVVPLMTRWRALARALVDRAHPFNIDDTADEASARERLLKGLDVNGSLFTFPVTLSALLAPLVTSLLAVYVPEIGK